MTLGRMASAKWNNLPCLVLGSIYEYLEPQDRLQASRACKNWRSELFQKRFFKNLKFHLHIENERQFEFFRHTAGNLTYELTIHFDFLNVFHIEKIQQILLGIACCDNVQGLRFETNSVLPPGEVSTDGLIDIENCVVLPLKAFLARKQTPCTVLDFGLIEALTYYGLDLMRGLGRPQDLQQLTLASMKFDPSHYPIFSADNLLFQNFLSLQVLSLDYDTINEDLLSVIEVLPLKKLLICVHGLDREHPGISELAWTRFAANFQNIELFLTLVYAYEAVEVLQVRILRRNMPITHLRVLFCDFINIDALDWMSLYNNSTLRSIQWIDSAYKDTTKNVMDLFVRSGQDPFVMMSWRCKNLEDIVIHGYILDLHNMVGISRLRGHKLKRLEISMIDNTPTEPTIKSFVEEIGCLIGQKWQPIHPSCLHPALGYIPVPDEVRDDYIFESIRSDISR